MKRRIYELDVFTDTPFEGNPLAVVTDGDGLSNAKMQAIAREMNLSETVFIQRPTSDRALARLRIFTTTQELKLAGHPVIGTWFLLAELGVVPAQNGAVHVWQQTGAGVLPVEIEFTGGRPSRVTMTQAPAEFRAANIRKPALARSLNLSPRDLHASLPLEYVNTGIYNLMVPLKSRDALKRIRPDVYALADVLGRDGVMAYCFVPGANGRAFARGMIPWELMEDPGTGSAGGSLGAYLVKHGKLRADHTLEIAQGVEMGRPCKLYVSVARDGKKLVPRVSGSAVRIWEGEIDA